VRRVAFAVPGDLDAPTGGYAYDRRMIAELRQLGWRVDVIGLGEGFPWPHERTRSAAQTRLVQVPPGDPIVIDGLAFAVLPDTARRLRFDRRLVALIHHPLALESGLSAAQSASLRDSESAALSCAARVVTTSAATARRLVAEYRVPAARVSVAPPGTDPAPRARGSGGDIVQLLSVGAVVPRKGFDVLVAALATLTDLNWHLSIVGDAGRDRRSAGELEADLVRLRLSDRVTLLGALPPAGVAKRYDQADVFVLASRFEGYGMAYAEALARGLPIIATTAGAIPDTVPADAGLLVAPDDAIALAAALRHLIEHSDARHKLAAGSWRAASRLPKWRESAEIFAGILETIE
jgi:glycosyltransferase involved in cell wall biosynthesis